MANINWARRIATLERITKNAGCTAWDVARQCHYLKKDKAFIADCEAKNETVEDRLLVYSGRIGFRLDDLLAMYNEFPKKTDWQSQRLDLLLDDTCRKINARQCRSKGKTTVRGANGKANTKDGVPTIDGKWQEELASCLPPEQQEPRKPQFVSREKYDRLLWQVKQLEQIKSNTQNISSELLNDIANQLEVTCDNDAIPTEMINAMLRLRHIIDNVLERQLQLTA